MLIQPLEFYKSIMFSYFKEDSIDRECCSEHYGYEEYTIYGAEEGTFSTMKIGIMTNGYYLITFNNGEEKTQFTGIGEKDFLDDLEYICSKNSWMKEVKK